MDSKSLHNMTSFANRYADKQLLAADKEIKHTPVINSIRITEENDAISPRGLRAMFFLVLAVVIIVCIIYFKA